MIISLGRFVANNDRDFPALSIRPFFLLLVCGALAACNKVAPESPPQASAPPGASVIADAPFTGVPEPKDAVIYQVNFRAFAPTKNFAAVQARLDSIRALGVNVLYLMPIYPVGQIKGVNSPYCIKDYTALNSEFGSLAELRTLIAEAHKRNMAVLFDWVADHTSWDNPWITHKSWYKQDAAGNIISPPGTGWLDVAALNYNSTEMRDAMIKAMTFWVSEANIDGYRCDAADFVPHDFWKQAIDALRAIPGRKLLLLAEGTRKDNFAAGFQLKYGMSFFTNLEKNVFGKKGSARSLDDLNAEEYANAPAADQVVRYTSNHDMDLSDGTPLDLFGGKDGSLAAFVVAAYMKGVPMIYNGQEVGCPVKLSYFNTSTSIDWTMNPELTDTYEKIVNLRNSSEAIKQGKLSSFSSEDVCAFVKSYKSEEVLVVVNLRNSPVSYAIPSALSNTEWKDAYNGTEVTLTDHLELQPFQYEVLRKQD
ncbi:MAG: alpha-glucosidase C-terminal domain-containing protein [Chthoniobacterales bacterium]|nr:alpha-glucosidase C-terminal domain-containing protein [Chthoniobacterales bacterium]